MTPLSRSKLVLWAVKVARAEPIALGFMLATTLLIVAVELVRPWPLKILIDNGISGEPLSGRTGEFVSRFPGTGDQSGIVAWSAAATVVIFLIGWAATTLAAIATVLLSQRMTISLAHDVHDHLQTLSPFERQNRRTGDLLRRVVGDTGSLATIVVSALIPALTAVLSLVTTLVVMWSLNLPLTLLALAVVPLLGFVIWIYAGRMERAGLYLGTAYGDLYTAVEEHLSAVPVIQAFAREPDSDQAIHQAGQSTLDASMTATKAQMDFKIAVGIAAAIGTASVLLVGGWQAMSGSLTVGTLLVFISYVAALYAPLAALTYSSATVLQASGGAQRVHELLAQPPRIQEKPDAQDLPPIAGSITFDAVTVGYEPGRPVLAGVDLSIQAGELIVLTGASGIGKSTLVSLIPRFLDPWQGAVRIDGTDLRDVTIESIRSQIAIVTQEPMLLPMTVAENIAFGLPTASDDAIRDAARLAQADRFIEELANGYDTAVGERGATLSGGQRQRIAIARALLLDPPILILDEPTSALDPETERQLLNALQQCRSGRTTILISHRPVPRTFPGRTVALDALIKRNDELGSSAAART